MAPKKDNDSPATKPAWPPLPWPSAEELVEARRWWIETRREQGLADTITDPDTIAAIREALAGVIQREQWRIKKMKGEPDPG